MKRVAVVVLAMAFSMMFAMSISVAYAKPPTAASGTWEYTPTIIPESVWFADNNMFFDATSVDTWAGTIQGEGGSVESLEIHKFVSWTETGFWYARGTLTLDPCTVATKSGKLVILYVGKGTPEGEWTGEWVILSGTDGLAHLHGQGTWTYPGGYEGQIHFNP